MQIGLDLGGTFTKVCAILETGERKYTYFPTKLEEIKKFFLVDENNNLIVPEFGQEVKHWAVTGGGAYKFKSFFESLPLKPNYVDELGITALGAHELIKGEQSKLNFYGKGNRLDDQFLVVSMGTGVSFTLITPGESRKHVGGSALGGGTLMGLAKLLIGVTNFDELLELAAKGNSNTYDLLVSDIYGESYGTTLTSNVTAASFAKAAIQDVNGLKEDIAAALISTICYSVGGQVAAIAQGHNTKTIIFVGGFLSEQGVIPVALEAAATLFVHDITLVVPRNHRYAGALGAALSSK